jgi:hypothetical protein
MLRPAIRNRNLGRPFLGGMFIMRSLSALSSSYGLMEGKNDLDLSSREGSLLAQKLWQ